MDFQRKGIYNSEPYSFRKLWGNFGTVTGKFELYSETLKKALAEHAQDHNTDIDDFLAGGQPSAHHPQGPADEK